MRCLLLAILLGLFACDNAPAEAVVVNGHADMTLEKVWFRTTMFFRPIGPGSSSEALRVGTGVEHAYAVIRLGEDDLDAGTKAKRFVARTREPVDSQPSETVKIVFSPTATRSPCTKEEWDFITTRIFPTEAIEPFEACN
jgi:hypothetical protein